jgi:hypothetical protein
MSKVKRKPARPARRLHRPFPLHMEQHGVEHCPNQQPNLVVPARASKPRRRQVPSGLPGVGLTILCGRFPPAGSFELSGASRKPWTHSFQRRSSSAQPGRRSCESGGSHWQFAIREYRIQIEPRETVDVDAIAEITSTVNLRNFGAAGLTP